MPHRAVITLAKHYHANWFWNIQDKPASHLIYGTNFWYSESGSSYCSIPLECFALSEKLVLIAPAHTVVTEILNGRSSRRRESEKACRAALVALYPPLKGVDNQAETEPMLTMRPSPVPAIPGTTACQVQESKWVGRRKRVWTQVLGTTTWFLCRTKALSRPKP